MPSLQLFLFLTLPLIAMLLAAKVRVFSWLSPVLLAYLFGILLGNVGDLPVDRDLAATLTEISVPLAIPLLLFSTDFLGWLRHARRAAVAFGLAVVSVLIVAFLAGLLFAPRIDEAWTAAGMLVGVYTGGTPNLLSIGLALNVSEETYILLNAADVVLSGVYLFFLLALAKPLLGRVLPAYAGEENETRVDAEAGAEAGAETREPDGGATESAWRKAGGMVLALLLSVLILGASAGMALLLAGELAVPIVILGITTLGIAASFVPAVRGLAGSESLGNYFILLFCVAIGTLTDFGALIRSGSTLFLMTAFVIYGAIALHYGLCVLFRVDVDTAIITSTAAVFGPPFVPPIADALDNKGVLLSGLTTGLVGYAVANYLGLGLAWLGRWLGG
jgi:uncharacterized membrane protein